MSLSSRIKHLEDIVAQHLKESGSIQANLKWNTTITCGIAIAVLGKLIVDYLIK